jgi:hypothetical protein
MGGSSPSRANKFLYEPAPPPPLVWALKPPSWAFVHKTTCAPMIYTALFIKFWMRAYPLRISITHPKHYARGFINHRCILVYVNAVVKCMYI